MSAKNRSRRGEWVHVGDAIADFLSSLEIEIEEEVVRTGGFEGPVRPEQRPWSRALEDIESERQDTVA